MRNIYKYNLVEFFVYRVKYSTEKTLFRFDSLKVSLIEFSPHSFYCSFLLERIYAIEQRKNKNDFSIQFSVIVVFCYDDSTKFGILPSYISLILIFHKIFCFSKNVCRYMCILMFTPESFFLYIFCFLI